MRAGWAVVLRVAVHVWWGPVAVMVTVRAAGTAVARVTVAVPAGVAVAAARASAPRVPEVVTMTVAGCPGARLWKVTLAVTVACWLAVVPWGLGVWVMVRVGVLGVLVSRVVAAVAPASRAASRSRTVAAWVG